MKAKMLVLLSGALIVAQSSVALAGPTAITACRSLDSGSYRLINDISVSGTDCFTVSGPYVTLDLSGHTLSNTGSAGSTVAVKAGTSGGLGFSLRNGKIQGFAKVLNLGSSPYVSVKNLTVGADQDTLGAVAQVGPWSRVESVHFEGSNEIDGNSRALEVREGSLLIDSQFDPGCAGIAVTNSTVGSANGVLVQGNEIAQMAELEAEDGLNLGAAEAVGVLDNRIEAIRHLTVFVGATAIVSGNVVSGDVAPTPASGIDVGAGSLIWNNQVTGCDTGAYPDKWSLVIENTFDASRGHGLVAQPTGSGVDAGVFVVGNLIRNSGANGSFGSGIVANVAVAILDNNIESAYDDAIFCATGNLSGMRNNVASGTFGSGSPFDSCSDLGGNAGP